MPSSPIKNGLYWSEQTQTWHYLITIFGGKKGGDTGCPTWPLAVAWLEGEKTRLRQKRAGGHPEASAPSPTLLEALAAWLKVHEGVSGPRHCVNVKGAVMLHAAPLHDTPVNQITEEDLEALRATYLRGEGKGYHGARLGRTPGGANRMVHHVRLVITRALKRQAPGPKPLKPDPKVRGVLWPEQVQPFLAEARKGGRYQAADARQELDSVTAMSLMIGLGLREIEATGARWEWWDTRRQVYIVGRAKNRQLREIPVPGWLAKHLAARRKAQGNPTRGLMLPAAVDKAGRQLRHVPGFTTKPVTRCARLLKIEGLTPHRLRATFATAHFESGTPLSQIQQMLGHKHPTTTMRYIVQRSKGQAEAQEKVARAMGFKPTPPSRPQRKPTKKLKPTITKKTA